MAVRWRHCGVLRRPKLAPVSLISMVPDVQSLPLYLYAAHESERAVQKTGVVPSSP